MLSRAAANRLEQRTLQWSIGAVLAIAVGSVGYGLWIDSEVVILNGVFSLFSLIGAGLSLLAARLVVRPEDRRFPFGYSHIEPLVLSVNGFMVLVVCIYAFINGIEGIRAGGRAVDPAEVMLFGAVSGAICLGMWLYQMTVARKVDSQFIRDDAREWLIDFGFSMVTLVAFAALPLLREPRHGVWAQYADPVMVSLLALIALPVPLGVLRRNLREVLLMTRDDDEVTRRVEAVMAEITSEHDIVRYVPRVVKRGRRHFIEIDIVVGPAFALQTVAQQDTLRERIWRALDKPLEDAWLSIAVTGDTRWI
ncbi:cation diffusion facilitator family transporter [Thioalkalivibrio sp. XN8]|uniref:cation diffusion facilitator family transporter n=1 Tax=Thioalkalivibrio sp. XN8 TaxID=2712863 RepID=UPI0013EB1F70|nr:cation diffusion facilitator family transporter [Thioalkalivibrio sp. XN8]NGP53143.1 cation diffusion facilitator family transporter [Thioalkalivibrio sp. XN8]